MTDEQFARIGCIIAFALIFACIFLAWHPHHWGS